VLLAGGSARVAAASTVPLAVTISLAEPAIAADTLTLHSYRLSDAGPSHDLPAGSLVATVDVARGSAACGGNAGARACRGSAAIPEGTDVVVAVLTQKERVVAEAFAVVDASGPAGLAFDAGGAAIADLTIAPPVAIAGRAFGIGATAYAGDGHVAMLDPASQRIDVRVYGPEGVVPSPRASVGGGGMAAAFRYSGRPFANPMTVTAVVGSMSNTAQIFPRSAMPAACAPLGDTGVIRVPEPQGVRHGFRLYASVAGGTVVHVGLDTGSTSLAIAKSKLAGALADELIGPGRRAQVTYEPSGVTLYGNYYLAPVSLFDEGGKKKLATTVPMEVFVATMQCAKHRSPPCPPDNGTAYMGVGFGRPSPKPPQGAGSPLMATPLQNAFMQLAQIVQGPMHPGFVLAPDRLTIGLDRASAAGASFVGLTPYPGRLGDWQGPPACLRFNAGPYQCGRMLVDIGIASMFVHADVPASFDRIEIVSPDARRPLLQYAFDYPVRPDATPPAPSPRGPKPVAFVAPPAPVFVNTGRDLLAAASYVYDAGCGRAGFER